ncbi:MAG TPA: hypothetical protein VFU31_19390, partial [Candidatus Binatia bacterium]|nr:hypothetical protein [Candidatus Binatia bacterium]
DTWANRPGLIPQTLAPGQLGAKVWRMNHQRNIMNEPKQPVFAQHPWSSTFIGHAAGVDYWWQYNHARSIGPNLIAISGENARDMMHHQLPHGFKPDGQGVDFAKCVALHNERQKLFPQR